MSTPRLLVRADASVAIGTGHVMRCLALAQAWQDSGGRVVFAMAETTPGFEERLRSERVEVIQLQTAPGSGEDCDRTTQLVAENNAECVVVDGYQFGDDYQHGLKVAGCRILLLDDYGHAHSYSADFVLNQNVSANAALYVEKSRRTRLLLGTSYALLRREFARWRDWKREISDVGSRVLVMMGGSDAQNLTLRVIESLGLAGLDKLEATIIVGAGNPHAGELHNACERSGLKISLQNSPLNVAELMAAADVAVSAAGSTCWELCLLGLPALLIDVATNQTAVARELDRGGYAIHVGNGTVAAEKIAKELQRLCNDGECRRDLSRRSRELIDGRGARRVVTILRGADALRLRLATPEDRRLFWEWANDPVVRAAAFSSEPISWATHVAWFDEKLGNPRSIIFVAEGADSFPVGQIRFDSRPDGDWEVDVSISRAMRGFGFASESIKLGLQAMREQKSRVRIHAFVKTGNSASIGAFERAAFRKQGLEQVRGHAAIHLVYEEN
jgi:UDP-2,4-diacetamido-2,4,6-trideoxy-beta-L-altropyranose hydrolase